MDSQSQSPNQQPSPPGKVKLLVYVYEDERKIGPVCDSYKTTVALCRDMFPALKTAPDIGVYTKALDICKGQLAEIYAESWKDVVDHIDEVVIMDQSRKKVEKERIYVKIPDGNSLTFNVNLLSCTVGHIMAEIEKSNGIPAEMHRLIFGGRHLDSKQTLSQCSVKNDSRLELVLKEIRLGTSFRKPVIYLFNPISVDASVKLSVVPQWSLSAVYPVTTIKSGIAGSQSVSWKVRVHPEGHLTELSTGLDTAYLYWEALANPPFPSSPPASPLLEPGENVHVFDPTNINLNDENSVVISVDKVTPYLDATLKALGLHIEARTSFITYWLPSLLKHKYIAFRFLPQASYEQAAPLDISPTPDIVTRIFMVFKGIEESELEEWCAARKRVNDDVSAWIDIVGVDVGRTVDENLFRVIEWGGMEETELGVQVHG